jgi:hypothetical protein
MHTDLWREHVLHPFTTDRDRSRNIYAAPEQTRLAVHFMTGERTIPASDAKGHVHDQ